MNKLKWNEIKWNLLVLNIPRCSVIIAIILLQQVVVTCFPISWDDLFVNIKQQMRYNNFLFNFLLFILTPPRLSKCPQAAAKMVSARHRRQPSTINSTPAPTLTMVSDSAHMSGSRGARQTDRRTWLKALYTFGQGSHNKDPSWSIFTVVEGRQI